VPKPRHYSFDLWKTLLVSHPAFKPTRAEYFFTHCNPKRKTQAEVTATFLRLDYANTSICEQTGLHVAAQIMYAQVLMALCEHDLDAFSSLDIHALKVQMDTLFRAHPPQLLHESIPERLQQIREVATLSILSNTGFAEGPILRPILRDLGIGDLFHFQVYSDEVGVSKPNPEIFTHLLQGATQLNPGITPQEIAHIGDNALADYTGANRVDMLGVHAPDGLVPELLLP
jgi:putative hydrolase of the HAD superfamily